MYYTTIVFAEYGLAVIITILSMATIGMIILKDRDRYTDKCKAIMLFLLLTLAMCLLNFGLYYFDAVLKVYGVNAVFRIIDYLINSLQIVAWFVVFRTMSENKNGYLFYTGVITVGLYGFISAFAAGFFMNEYYHILSDIGMTIIFIGRSFDAASFIIMIICSIRFTKEEHTKLQTRYIYTTAAVIILGGISYMIAMQPLLTGVYNSGWEEGYFDTTGLYVLILSLLSYIFVFKEDFSSIFSDEVDLEIERNDMIHNQVIIQNLTRRECEVLELLCKGLHNPEIAEKLGISPNTVKKHVQNIFEKTGVNSRMELIYLVNLKNPPKTT